MAAKFEVDQDRAGQDRFRHNCARRPRTVTPCSGQTSPPSATTPSPSRTRACWAPATTVADLVANDHHVLGKRVLTSRGADIGKVTDVEFDHESGAIENLLLDDETVAGARLLGVGSDAVVVRAE